MERVADFVWRFLADRGCGAVFLMTGGNAMHLDDALGQQNRLKVVCVHHEQAGAMAAEGYARVDGVPGVVCTTSGPGAINALGGLYGAFADSLPVLCISGQAKRETLRGSRDPEDVGGLRQLGVQEADVVAMARPVTKYSALVDEPSRIRYELEKAFHLATSGRPGPVYLEVPLDVQAARMDPGALEGYSPQQVKRRSPKRALDGLARRLLEARRPVLVGGEGVSEAGATEAFRALAGRLGIPVVTAWSPDLYPPDQPHYAGRMGALGTRAGNFAVQNADFLLVVGSRLAIPQVSFNWENFAREAHVVSVNVDAAELFKPIHVVDEPYAMDPGKFLEELLGNGAFEGTAPPAWRDWHAWCRVRVDRYPEVAAGQRVVTAAGIHPYHFIEQLFELLEDDAFVACGNAASACVAFQSAPLRLGQRLTSNATAGAMGHDLPSAMGAAVARGGRRVICLAGDGSVMLNVQELQTVSHLKLPVGIFVMCNGGYHSIRTTQRNFFGRFLGESAETGVSFPGFVKVGEAFGLPSYRLDGTALRTSLERVLSRPAPWLCEVRLDPEPGLEPRLSSRVLADGRIVTAPLEDMFPFLPREELASNMLIAPVAEP